MSRRRRNSDASLPEPRRVLAGVLSCAVVTFAVLTCTLLAASPASAALLPPNFFDTIPKTTSGQAGVEADQLRFNSETSVLTAYGHVGLSYAGYFANADRMTFNQVTRELHLSGHVTITDPDGITYSADSVEVTDGLKVAILNSMVMETPDGSQLSSQRTRKVRDKVTELDGGTYAPCGTCVDAKGRKIGWRVRTSRIVQNTAAGYIDLDQPILEVLGVPIAWVPWMRLPDPTDSRGSGFRLPSYDYTDLIGLKLNLPYYMALNRDMGILLTPSLIATQGVLMSAAFSHNVGDLGSYSVTLSGIRQLNPGVFNPGYGRSDWRGAIQTSGHFRPAKNWTAGWSYTTFTDPAFIPQYLIPSENPAPNGVYAQYLTPQTYAEGQAQQFVLLGKISKAQQDKQAAILPHVGFDHVQDLGPDRGRVRIQGDLAGVARAADNSASNAIPYVLGYAEQKYHGTIEANWSRQFLFGAAAVTPSAGLRLDAAQYDGASALKPTSATLFAATPIAGIDVRVPFIANVGGSKHMIEPIGQIYYRGGDITQTGITNDNAQSFVFDDSNVFSYNRFSGTDRQETGLRANIGAHYLANFSDGSYLDLVLGQTFHLAGFNALASADESNAGAGAGLSRANSDVVAGFRAGIGSTISLSGKTRIDAASGSLAVASVAAKFNYQGVGLGLDYSYLAPDLARGITGTQQDAGASISYNFNDYWTVSAATGWDLTAQKLIDYSAGLIYDDGYFSAGATIQSSGPLIYDPQTFSYKFTLKLKGPDGTGIGL